MPAGPLLSCLTVSSRSYSPSPSPPASEPPATLLPQLPAGVLLRGSARACFLLPAWESCYVDSKKRVIIFKRGLKKEEKKCLKEVLVHFARDSFLGQPEACYSLNAVVCIFIFLAWWLLSFHEFAYCSGLHDIATVLQLLFACTYML